MFKNNRGNFGGEAVSAGNGDFLDLDKSKNREEKYKIKEDEIQRIAEQLRKINREKLEKAEREATAKAVDILFDNMIINNDDDEEEKNINFIEEKVDNDGKELKTKNKKESKKTKDSKEIKLNGESFFEGDIVFFASDSKREKECEIKKINKNTISLFDLKQNVTFSVNLNLIKEKSLISHEERFEDADRKKLWSEVKKIHDTLSSFDLSFTKIKGVTQEENLNIRLNKQMIYKIFNEIGFSNETDKFIFSGTISNKDIKSKIKELKVYIKSTEDIIAKYLKK
jgi:hypothetical protein